MSLTLWDEVRKVPESAKKPISGGRLSGKTDINPVWRLKTLTEQFGPCGVGWKYTITDKTIIDGANGEKAAFVDIDLYYKKTKLVVDQEGIKGGPEWSEPTPGTGGSMFVSKDKNGLYTNDECFKMALTDAISVACKALGVAADVYWGKDSTKYDKRPEYKEPAKQAETNKPVQKDTLTKAQLNEFGKLVKMEQKPDEAKARLKRLVTSLGYEKLSEVKQSEYEKLKNQYLEYGLPFDLGEEE